MKVLTLEDLYRKDPDAACRQAIRDTKHIHNPHSRMVEIDKLLCSHGVEALQLKNNRGRILYCNMGDPYCTTVLWKFEKGCFGGRVLPSKKPYVGCWGSLAEAGRLE